jgi:hypothetical protein
MKRWISNKRFAHIELLHVHIIVNRDIETIEEAVVYPFMF